MNAQEWLARASKSLAERGIESPLIEARALLAHALSIPPTALIAHPETPVPPEADALLQRRLRGEPLAYVLGRKEFAGKEFLVTRDVLIPRPETELVLEEVLLVAPRGAICLDLGAGSGCIGISAATARPDTRWVLTDISEPALSVACENARALGASVFFAQADALEAFRAQSFHIIACNPPYVAFEDERLDESVRRWEPAVALFAQDSGLAFLKRLARDVPRTLKPGGTLVIEVGIGQAGVVGSMLAPRFDLRIRQDYAGVERVVIAALR
ncbi:MAG: peptide chain release factor N(5)-glutamine methyltransferase [Armatimonadota bacterium]